MWYRLYPCLLLICLLPHILLLNLRVLPGDFFCVEKNKKNCKKHYKKIKILHIIYVRDKARGAGAVTAILHQRMLAYCWKYGHCRNAEA